MTPVQLIAMDPGTEKTAICTMFPGAVVTETLPNYRALLFLRGARLAPDTKWPPLAIEMIASYGMPVGKEVFETCLWIGRFIEAYPGPYKLIYRRDVKMHLCHSMKANDAAIRQALIDRYGPGKEKAIGNKKTPGPLYGVHKDEWAALGVAVTALDYEARIEG